MGEFLVRRGIGTNFARQLHAACNETDDDEGLRQLKTTARWLDRLNPDAAASLARGWRKR